VRFFAQLINNFKCYICCNDGDIICDRCFLKLEFIYLNEQICNSKVYSLLRYNQIAAKILIMSKYPPYNFYILKFLISKLQIPKFPKNTFFCPVPLSSLKMFERGFNQAEVIAKQISKDSSSVVNLIRRKKDTQALFSLNKIFRRIELKKAFRISLYSKIIPNKQNIKIVIIDDLITTGETVTQCITVLKDEGFKDIQVLSLFRA